MRLLGSGSPPEVTPFSMNRMTMSFGRVIGCGGGAFDFDHQHVAVGKRVKRARMLKAGGEGLNLQPCGDLRRLTILPTNDRREMHLRKQILLDVRQNGIWTNCGFEHRKAHRRRPQALAPMPRLAPSTII